MEVFVTVAQVVAPIFAAIILGVLAKKNTWVTAENVQGFQKFVMKFGLPCVVFNSCLTAQIGVESLTSMALICLRFCWQQSGPSGLGRKNSPITIFHSCSAPRNPVCWVSLCL